MTDVKMTDLISRFDAAWNSTDGAEVAGSSLRINQDELAAMYEIYATADKSMAENLAVIYVQSQVDSIRTGFQIKSLAKWALGDTYQQMKLDFLQAEHLVGVIDETSRAANEARAAGNEPPSVEPADLYQRYVARIQAGLDE